MKDLANRVIKGVYPPLPSVYSQDFQNVIKRMLVVTPSKRPSPKEILDSYDVKAKFTETINKIHADLHLQEPSGLLGTILLPRNLRQLDGRLPAPNYLPKR